MVAVVLCRSRLRALDQDCARGIFGHNWPRPYIVSSSDHLGNRARLCSMIILGLATIDVLCNCFVEVGILAELAWPCTEEVYVFAQDALLKVLLHWTEFCGSIIWSYLRVDDPWLTILELKAPLLPVGLCGGLGSAMGLAFTVLVIAIAILTSVVCILIGWVVEGVVVLADQAQVVASRVLCCREHIAVILPVLLGGLNPGCQKGDEEQTTELDAGHDRGMLHELEMLQVPVERFLYGFLSSGLAGPGGKYKYVLSFFFKVSCLVTLFPPWKLILLGA